MLFKAFWLIMGGVLSWAAHAQAAKVELPFTATGIFTRTNPEDSLQWFDLWNDRMRFVLDRKDADKVEPLVEILNNSTEQGWSMQVVYDPSRARFDPSSGRVEYPICSVTLNELRFESGRVCGQASLNKTPSSRSPEAMLASAVALADSSSPSIALALLDALLSNKHMDRGLLPAALETRASALSALGLLERSASPEADGNFVRALADYRKLDVLAPGNLETQLSIGFALEQLGDYAGAQAQYETIHKPSFDEDFRVTIRLAALARQMGNADRSLELINGLVARHGPQDGMRYHYHRGWTLNLLGRFDEAIVDLTAGMKSQPDYAWAQLRRACANGSTGRLDAALSDIEAAVGLINRTNKGDDPAVRSDLARANEIVSALKTRITKGQHEPTPIACEGYANDYSRPRAKSALLQP